MSLMFPTIYGIALTGVRENVKFAGAGLVMSILGGSVVPPIQAAVMDIDGSLWGIRTLKPLFSHPLGVLRGRRLLRLAVLSSRHDRIALSGLWPPVETGKYS
jgi:hypothetical protein